MTENKPTGIGFIGAGEISILHAKAIHAIPEARLVGLWNRTQSRAMERAQMYGCRQYATPEELVKDPEIEAVFVLTDLDTHLKYTKLAWNTASTSWSKNRSRRRLPKSRR